MIKKRRVKRDAFIISSHIILRQFRCAGHRGCKQFSSSSTNSASDSHAILTNVTSGFEVCSLCVWPASVTKECASTLSARRHSLTRSFIVQLIRMHETIDTPIHACHKNTKRHTDKIVITSSRYKSQSEPHNSILIKMPRKHIDFLRLIHAQLITSD